MRTLRAASLLVAILPVFASIPEPVKIEQGQVTGVAGATDGVRVFKGIPFAEPPLGDRRWKAPKAAASWTGVRAADKFGAQCVQGRGGSTSEDCLYLNIYTAAKSAGEKRPVMVWIHGGALTSGAGSIYDGEALAKKGVVLVTINYRLGVFGFFAHPDLTKESDVHSSGNYGLLDQLMGLQWVQKNIAAFGGNPKNVTIFGESAGSWSVNYLTATPLAKGLFQRVIGESGAEFAPARKLAALEETGVAAAKAANANSLAELRAKSTADVSAMRFRTGVNVDGWLLPNDVYTIYKEGKQNDVPMLIGSNGDEGTMFTQAGVTMASLKKTAEDQYGKDAAEFLQLYPASNDTEAYDAAAHNMRDRTFSWEMRTWARMQSTTGKNKVYMYYFSHVPAPPQAVKGAYHGSEIPYAFGNLIVAPFAVRGATQTPAWTDYDKKLADEMSSYWVNFATTGDPNGKNLPKWPAFKAVKNEVVMSLGDTVEAKPVPNKAQLDFLDKYFEAQRAVPNSAASR
jgi:para-nitrobenzyl esterase